MRRLVAAMGIGLVGGCVEYNVNGAKEDVPGPSIYVDPDIVSFGAVDLGVEQAAVVTIDNIGGDTLTLDSLDLLSGDAFTLNTDSTASSLEPGEQTEAIITYTPWTVADVGSLSVKSNDPEQPVVTVPVSGSLDVPLLAFTPSPMDFGRYAAGHDETLDLTMSNEGAATLDVSNLILLGDRFSADLPDTPLSLEPGESISWPVTFSPDDIGDFTGTLWAASNAGTGNDSVALTGEGVSEPVAVCAVDPNEVSTHADQPTWMGDESYDPSGAAITNYDWELIVQPDGSTAVMPDGGSDRYDFAWDLVGTYVGQLIVTNEYGVASEPCVTILNTTTDDDLWIEMYWETAHDDMDLHLLAPGGTKNSMEDCHWANCTGAGLDWGIAGDDSDDPSLDLDDIPGTGPENIRIASPDDGVYTVMVQDYPNTKYQPANAVTVNIYISGVLVWTDTRDLAGEAEWETYATVSFPDGTVTPE